MKLIGVWIGGVLVVLGALYFFPWKITWNQPRTITVVGEATNQAANEVATFNAGVSAVNDNKEMAVKEVNNQIAAIIESVKAFGIEEKDIKTQNMNIYQNQETYYDNGTQKQRLGQWNVSNTVEITLRKVDRASELADLLSKSGANNVWGPNFALDASNRASDALTEQAIENAREKADKMATAMGAKLGKVVTVVEGSNGGVVMPYARMEGAGGGGVPTQAGSTTVSKSVSVTFELK